MTAAVEERYRRAQAIAHELLDCPLGAREARLAAACMDDDALRREVEWLIASVETGERDDGLLDAGVDRVSRAVLGNAFVEASVAGAYRLVERIGEGGMGQVWLAERDVDGAPQRVALKMLRGTGLASIHELARFIDEGRILAGLNHPNIAHLIEAGRGTNGEPFLAMELVEGERIERWCESHGLSARARVELFLKVCAAVEHAHANLVIHRDLKPANIIVDGLGEPKLLDFGIARLLDANAQGARAVTATCAMTLAYASPEQIEGKRLGTATDIYSLGVVLYELLAGVRPFDHLETDHARSNAIVSGEVAAPSRVARKPALDARRNWTPRRIPVDLDAIVIKALRREPGQRYASVVEFADDLRAFLASRPVLARRGQFGYRVRRFVWRNRWAIAGSSMIFALAAGFTWRTVLAEREARDQAAISDRVSGFLVSVFAAADSDVNKSLTHELTAREVLDAGTARIDTELADQPRIRARLLEAVGNAYRHMNANAKGVSLLREAADIYLDAAIDQPLDGARVLEAMANAMANGQFPARDAEAAARASLALAERFAKPGSQAIANAWMVLSLALNRAGNLVAAEHAARTTYAMNERLPMSEDNRIDAALGNLCIILTNRGMLAEAAPFCEQSYERRAEGRTITLAMALSRLSQLRAAQGDFSQALALSAEGLALTRELKGEVSQFGTMFTARRALILDDAGHHAEAQPLFEKVLADAELLEGQDSGEALDARLQMARHQARLGNFTEAIKALRDIVPAVAARYGDDDPRAVFAKTVLAQALLDSGIADAVVRQLLDEAIAGWDAKDDPDAVQPAYTRLALAQWFVMNGDTDAAKNLLDRIEAGDSRADRVVRAAAADLRLNF